MHRLFLRFYPPRDNSRPRLRTSVHPLNRHHTSFIPSRINTSTKHTTQPPQNEHLRKNAGRSSTHIAIIQGNKWS